jgi:hypothetical protein
MSRTPPSPARSCRRPTPGAQPRRHHHPKSPRHYVGYRPETMITGEGQAAVFGAVDHCSAECVGIHAAASRRSNRSVKASGSVSNWDRLSKSSAASIFRPAHVLPSASLRDLLILPRFAPVADRSLRGSDFNYAGRFGRLYIRANKPCRQELAQFGERIGREPSRSDAVFGHREGDEISPFFQYNPHIMPAPWRSASFWSC